MMRSNQQRSCHVSRIAPRIALVAVVAVTVGGCALPVPLQVAGWVLDGVSVLTTEKTITDHGLSMVAGKDCSVWRGVVEGDVCRDERGNILMAAVPGERGPRPMLSRQPVQKFTAEPPIEGPYLSVR